MPMTDEPTPRRRKQIAKPTAKPAAKPREVKPPPRAEKVAAFRTGISAESRAAALLIAKGYRILARRWRSPAGEIDIVARRRQTLIFVEVKARADLDAAAEAVTPRQRQRIAAAAEIWLAANPDTPFTDIRFDAMLVAPGCMPRHIPAAFDAA
jgi:putative endonuclease